MMLQERCATGHHDPDAEVIMRVARKGVVGEQRQRLDLRNSGSMLLDAMYPSGHALPQADGSGFVANAVAIEARPTCRSERRPLH